MPVPPIMLTARSGQTGTGLIAMTSGILQMRVRIFPILLIPLQGRPSTGFRKQLMPGRRIKAFPLFGSIGVIRRMGSIGVTPLRVTALASPELPGE